MKPVFFDWGREGGREGGGREGEGGKEGGEGGKNYNMVVSRRRKARKEEAVNQFSEAIVL